MRSLIDDKGCRNLCQSFEFSLATAMFRREESGEEEIVSWQPRSRKSCNGGGRAWDGYNLDPFRAAGLHKHMPGIREQGRSGIADQSDVLSGAQEFEQTRSSRHLVMIVIAFSRGPDTEMLQESCGMAGIFAGDEVDFLEDPESPKRYVLQITDRRGDQVKLA